MAEPSPDLIQRAEKALHDGNVQQARLLLVEFIKNNPKFDRAWWLLSFAVTEANQQIDCLERVLKLNPAHPEARQRLAKLKGSSSQPLFEPAVGPFAAEDEPGFLPVEAPSLPVPRPAATPAWSARPDGPNPPAAGTQVGPGPVLRPPASSAPARRPAGPPAGAVPPPRKTSRKWLIADLVMAVMALSAIALMAGYLLLTQLDSAEAQAVQPTQGVAERWTATPSPTITATWTPSGTHTPTETASITPTPRPTRTETSSPTAMVGPMISMRPPDFSLTNAGTGQSVSLSAFEGRPILLVFWATWCQFCAAEMSDLEVVYRDYLDDGLVLLAVNAGDSRAAINTFRSARGLSFPMLVDGNLAINKLYGVTSIPRHFFVHPNGRISNIGIGQIALEELDWQIKMLVMQYSTPTP